MLGFCKIHGEKFIDEKHVIIDMNTLTKDIVLKFKNEMCCEEQLISYVLFLDTDGNFRKITKKQEQKISCQDITRLVKDLVIIAEQTRKYINWLNTLSIAQLKLLK